MTKQEIIIDSLIDDDECISQIKEYFEQMHVNITEKELNEILDLLLEEEIIIINNSWTNEKNEFPYSLTKKGKEIWNNIK